MRILIGTHIHPAEGDTARRQQNGLESILGLKNIEFINLQFQDHIIEVEGAHTIAELKNDSQKVSGKKGVRKPITTEVFNKLAEKANLWGCHYFGFTNSDIIITQAAIDLIKTDPRQAYIFSRLDFDREDDNEQKTLTSGQDFFLIKTKWWLENNWRFRPYIVGESCWDNVYTSIILCHSKSVLLNKTDYIRHERHTPSWSNSPFAQYTRLLAALDAQYFSLWVKYWVKLNELRSQNADEDEELMLQQEMFVYRPHTYERIEQIGRNIKAILRYRVLKAIS